MGRYSSIVACVLRPPYPADAKPIIRFYVDIGRKKRSSDQLARMCDASRILCAEYGANYRYHTFEPAAPLDIDPAIPMAHITDDNNVLFRPYARPVEIDAPLESYAVVDSTTRRVAVVIDAVPVQTAGFAIGKMARKAKLVDGRDSVGFPVYLWAGLRWPTDRSAIPRIHIDEALVRANIDMARLLEGSC